MEEAFLLRALGNHHFTTPIILPQMKACSRPQQLVDDTVDSGLRLGQRIKLRISLRSVLSSGSLDVEQQLWDWSSQR